MERPSGNVITFTKGNTRYELLTIKEDTGEPHTVIAWKVGQH
jgi:hypothetical protein